MISTALAGTREKQKQMKMKVSRNVEVWFYFFNERQVFTMRFLEFLVVQTHPSGVACWRHFFPWGSEFCSTSEWSLQQLFVVPKIGRLCMLVQSPNLVQVLCSASNFTGQQIHQSKRSILKKSYRHEVWFKLGFLMACRRHQQLQTSALQPSWKWRRQWKHDFIVRLILHCISWFCG